MRVPHVTYTYKVLELVKVVDGDTIDVALDLGFGLANGTSGAPLRLRLARIDTPEMNAKSASVRKKARAATEAVKNYLAFSYAMRVQTTKSDSFGRYLAEVWFKTSYRKPWINLSNYLLEKGHAKLWKRKKRKKRK